MNLVEQLIKSRESSVTIKGHKFLYRRPTDMDAQGMSYPSVKEAIKDVSTFFYDWDLKELDIVPGGTGEPAPFSNELFWEWVKDKPDYWQQLVSAVLESYRDYTKKRDKSGNS